MDNMKIYNQMKDTPEDAQKTIEAGRLSGFTDINPMWRIKKLTECFGPCGVGWKIEIIDKQIIDGGNVCVERGKDETWRVENRTEKKAFVDILLFYKTEDDKWSAGVYGTGGASFVSSERNGLYTNDECFKMALTDAIGGACKLLGMSSDIYFNENSSKYETGDLDEDVFRKICSKQDSMKIVNASKNKWGALAPEKCSEILKKYGADSTRSLLEIYVDSVLKEIEKA